MPDQQVKGEADMSCFARLRLQYFLARMIWPPLPDSTFDSEAP